MAEATNAAPAAKVPAGVSTREVEYVMPSNSAEGVPASIQGQTIRYTLPDLTGDVEAWDDESSAALVAALKTVHKSPRSALTMHNRALTLQIQKDAKDESKPAKDKPAATLEGVQAFVSNLPQYDVRPRGKGDGTPRKPSEKVVQAAASRIAAEMPGLTDEQKAWLANREAALKALGADAAAAKESAAENLPKADKKAGKK